MFQLSGIAASTDARAARLSAQIADAVGLGPIERQIVRLADAYVTLTTAPDDGPALTSDDALWALWRESGEQYAPALVEALIEVVGQRRSQPRATGTHA